MLWSGAMSPIIQKTDLAIQMDWSLRLGVSVSLAGIGLHLVRQVLTADMTREHSSRIHGRITHHHVLHHFGKYATWSPAAQINFARGKCDLYEEALLGSH